MSVHLYPTGLQLTEKKLKRNADLNISLVNKSKYNKAQVLQYPDKQQLRFPSSTSDKKYSVILSYLRYIRKQSNLASVNKKINKISKATGVSNGPGQYRWGHLRPPWYWESLVYGWAFRLCVHNHQRKHFTSRVLIGHSMTGRNSFQILYKVE